MMFVDSTYFALLGEVILAVAGICFFTLAAVLIHEMGHVAAALLFGFRVVAVRVGPIAFKRQESTRWLFDQAGWNSGLVQAQFREVPGPWAAPRFAAFLLGGAVANISAASLLLQFSFSENTLGILSGCLMLACIFVSVCSLIPIKTKLGLTDGAKLLMMIFSRKRREDYIFRLSLLAHIIEIKTLMRHCEIVNAIVKHDELASRYAKLPDAKPEMAQLLSKLRDVLEKALAEPSAPNATKQVVEG